MARIIVWDSNIFAKLLFEEPDSSEARDFISACMEREDVTVIDDARKRTEGNRRFDNKIKESKTGCRSQPKHYHELVQCMTIFCS